MLDQCFTRAGKVDRTLLIVHVHEEEHNPVLKIPMHVVDDNALPEIQ